MSKKIFGLLKRKRGNSPSASETGSGTSRYELKDKDLGKLHKAAASGDLEKLKKLLKKGDLNQLDKQNRTPLHLACANGHSDIVLFLLQNKFVKLNLCDNDNRSPLMKAVQCQQDACVKALLEHKADPTLVDINGLTALHQAAVIPSCPIAELLIQHNAHINARNKDGNTPLMLAVSNSHLPMVELLLRRGANVDVKDRINRTPLIVAAGSGDDEIARVLLKHFADVSCKDEKGWTAEDHAGMNGHHACSHLIGEQGARAAQSRMSVGSAARASVLPELGAAARLGIPAPNKVGEDASHTETLSRTGPTAEEAGGSWPSTDDEDVLEVSPKKHLKPDLSKLLSVSQRLESEGSDPDPVPEQDFAGESADKRKLSGRLLSRTSLSSSCNRVRRPPLPSPWLDPSDHPHLHRHKEVNEEEEDGEGDGSSTDESLHSGFPSPGPPGPERRGPRSPRAARRDLMAELGLECEDADGEGDIVEDPDGGMDVAAEEKATEDDEEEDDVQGNKRWSPSNSEFSEAVSDKRESRPFQVLSAEMASKPSAIVSSNKQNVIDDLGLDDADDLEDASEWDSMGSRSEASHDAGPSPLKPPRVQFVEGKGLHAGRDAAAPLRAPASTHGDSRSHAPCPVREPPEFLRSSVDGKALPQGTAGTIQNTPVAGSANTVGDGCAPAAQQEPLSSVGSIAALEPTTPAFLNKAPSQFAGTLGSADNRRSSLVHPPREPTAASKLCGSGENLPLKIAEKVDGAAEVRGALTLPGVQTAALVNTSNNNSNVFSSAKPEHSSIIEDKSKFTLDEIAPLGLDPDKETFSSDETSHEEELDVKAITNQMITSDRPDKSAAGPAVRRGFQRGPADVSSQTGRSKPREIGPEPRNGRSVGRHTTDVVHVPEEHQGQGDRRDVIGSEGRVRSPASRPLPDPLLPTKRHPAASRERTARNGIEGNLITAVVPPADLTALTDSSDAEDSEGAMSGSLVSSINPILQGLFIADPAQAARLQAWVAETKRNMDKVENELSVLKKALSEITQSKERLEEEKVNLESDHDALRDSLQREQGKSKGVAKLYEKCQAQLQLREQQLLDEGKAKQVAECRLQNLQDEKSLVEKHLQRLEKKLSETQTDLENEKKLQLQQEHILNEQKQQQNESEMNRGEELERSALALENSKLQQEISAMKHDMQCQSTSFREKEELLMNAKNTLLEKLEALQRTRSVSEEALKEAVENSNVKLVKARAEADEHSRRLEQEKVDKERLSAELETVRKQFAQTKSEQGSAPEDNGGIGQSLQQRQQETAELQELRRQEKLLLQKLSQMEMDCNQLECDKRGQSLQLREREETLNARQMDLDAVRQKVDELDKALLEKTKEMEKLLVREASQKERMEQAHSNNQLLQQQLEAANVQMCQTETVKEIQNKFDDQLSILRADKNYQVQVLEEQKQALVADVRRLTERIRTLEEQKNENEERYYRVNEELLAAVKQKAMSEASVEVSAKHCTELVSEKTRLQKNLEAQEQQLLEKEREHVRIEQQLQVVQAALQQSRQEVAALATSDHENACSLDRTRRQLQELEDRCQRVERERSQLETAVQTHTCTAEALQAQLRDSAQDCTNLEERVKQLNEEKNALEEKLKQMESSALAASEEKVPQQLEPDAQLSLLMSTEKVEGAAKQLDQKRRRLKEVEGKLEHKSQECADLQEECNRMKSQVKSLKKEREQMRLSRSEGEPSRQVQEKRLEELTRQLQAAEETVLSLKRSNRELEEKLHQSKRHLQKQQLSSSVAMQAELERHKQELEEVARREIASKLQEVNMFLQSQAMSQETLEGLRSINELHLKQQMEQKLQKMEAEMKRLRSNAEESQNVKEHLEAEVKRYTSLYQEELSYRSALSSKLESANERLADTNAQLGSERQRSSQLMSGLLVDNTAFAALSATGLAQSHNFPHQPHGLHQPHGRASGLSHSLLSSPADSPNSRGPKHAYLFKMQQELDKSFSRELGKAYPELNGSSQRFSPLGAAGDTGERDPITRATSQYVDEMHKNYRV